MTAVDSQGSSYGDDRIAIHERFESSQAELWSAVVDGERLSAWFGGNCMIEPRVGGRVRFELPDDGIVADGVVRAFEAPREGMAVAHLEHTFVDQARPELTSVCQWSIVRSDSGCDLYFSMDGAGEADSSRMTEVWGRLADEDIRPGPSEDEAMAALASARTVLMVDWIGPEAPTTIAGIFPVVYGKIGPKPDDWALVEPDGSSFKTTRVARPRKGTRGEDVLVPLRSHAAASAG